MKTVAIFTTFSDIQKAYSLNIVTQNQIKMLVQNGYKPIVIVHRGFKPAEWYAHPDVTIEEIPNVPCHNEVKKDETFDEDVQGIYIRLKEILAKVDVVITHDVIYQNAALKHNFAARKIAKELPNVKWLHWIHSATSPAILNALRQIFTDEYLNLVQTPFPNALYIYPNNYAAPAVAKNFNVPSEQVKVVHHATDIAARFRLDPKVEQIMNDYDLLKADALAVYPVRLDTGKQIQHVIKTMAMLKEFDKTIRVIVIDFHSTGPEKVAYRDKCKQVAIDYHLSQDELLWTSELLADWKFEVPQEIVYQFMDLANVFIMPSVSETYSLITQEAALGKAVVVLNKDFPPFRDIYGPDAIYRKYSAGIDGFADLHESVREDSWTQTDYGPGNIPPEARDYHERMYHAETAGMIVSRLKHPELALARKLLKERNLQYVFKHELEPLFFT